MAVVAVIPGLLVAVAHPVVGMALVAGLAVWYTVSQAHTGRGTGITDGWSVQLRLPGNLHLRIAHSTDEDSP